LGIVKIENSNQACRLTIRGSNKNAKLGQTGPWRGDVTYF